MTSCKYCGTWKDYSGYGSSNRADIASLYVSGVNVTTELVVQVPEKTSHGIPEGIASSLRDRDIPYKIKIIHLTPDMYPRYMESNKYNIGRLAWETDRLPQEWVTPCNKMAEIWTTSERFKKVIEASGVTVPVYCFPEPIDICRGEESIKSFETRYKRNFTFYSIFQWIDRKNPRTLVRAYLRAFENTEDTTLLLKTYRVNYSEDQFGYIKRDIINWKAELGLKRFPRILLIKKLLQGNEMVKLHRMGDVYVNPSSGEGWCRPVQEAMLHGKPVISGDNGGITDYLSSDHYWRVSGSLQSATEASWIPWYNKSMHWWKLDEEDLIKKMREAYEHREESREKERKAQDWVKEHTSYQAVGIQMKQRLQDIERIL